jgi:RimJ/RimL family protein N-acetyltransferase
MEHYRLDRDGKALVIRDMERGDVDALVDYWHSATPEYIRSIGALPDKLRSRPDTAAIFLHSLEYQPGQPGRATFVVQHGQEVIGYTHLNIDDRLTAYAHVHVISSRARRRGLGRLLFRAMIGVFASCGIERLYFQTAPENRDVNNLLAKFGLTAEPIHLDLPDGMARPGRFNLYEIDKALMLRLAGRQEERAPVFESGRATHLR